MPSSLGAGTDQPGQPPLVALFQVLTPANVPASQILLVPVDMHFPHTLPPLRQTASPIEVQPQAWVLQDWVSEHTPPHKLHATVPPLLRLQVRVRLWVPPPQPAEQPLQPLQLLYETVAVVADQVVLKVPSETVAEWAVP